jgi:phosphonoacetaldehyde hydrolase
MTHNQYPYSFRRSYTGNIQAVIFDWAGTLVDFGSFAPTQVLVDAFSANGFAITLAEARVPMGLAKWDHIRTILHLPAVAARWQAQYGRSSTDADVDLIYERFMPLQVEQIARYSAPIPGAIGVLKDLRAHGIKIGSCSGYPRQVMDQLLTHAKEFGLQVDHAVAADDLAAGARPGPWMALENVIALACTEVAACVKVDDTVPGIFEGLSAGMWTVGLSLSGNEVGLSLAELQALSDEQLQRKREYATARLAQAGAHYIIDSVADLEPVLHEIRQRIARGERP